MKQYITKAVLHLTIEPGKAGNSALKILGTPPKKVEIRPKTLFTPRDENEEAELLAAGGIRLPNPGEDVSRYPVYDNGRTVEKSAEEIAAEEKARQEREAAAARIRQDAKAAADKAAAEKAAAEKAAAEKAAAEKAAAEKAAAEKAATDKQDPTPATKKATGKKATDTKDDAGDDEGVV